MALTPNGAAIRVIRERTGISLTGLAAKAGITKGQLSMIERGLPGGLNPRPEVMRGIADALGVHLAAITNLTPEPAAAEPAAAAPA